MSASGGSSRSRARPHTRQARCWGRARLGARLLASARGQPRARSQQLLVWACTCVRESEKASEGEGASRREVVPGEGLWVLEGVAAKSRHERASGAGGGGEAQPATTATAANAAANKRRRSVGGCKVCAVCMGVSSFEGILSIALSTQSPWLNTPRRRFCEFPIPASRSGA